MTPATSTSAKRQKRMRELLQIVEDRGSVDLHELTKLLGASAATIRRDVAVLAEQGLVIRTHGGVSKTQQRTELPISLRDGKNTRAKKAIAHEVSQLIPPGQQVIALNGGTTNGEVIASLGHRQDLTIVTNSVSLALEAAQQGQTRVFVTGGVMRPQSLELVGSLAEMSFNQIQIGTAIVGSDGVSANNGITTYDNIEAQTNRTMMESAQRVIVVADGSKIGRKQLAKSADISNIDILVTDSNANPAELAAIRRLGAQVIIVPIKAEPTK